MNRQCIVQVDRAGHPFAHVPAERLWDLVEYLSYHRVHVTYHFEAGDFHITFPTVEPGMAQRLLDEWAHAEAASGAAFVG